MQCPEATELMSLRLDVALSKGQDEALQQHVAACPSCRREWETMQRVSALFENASPAPPPPHLSEAVMVRIHQHNNRLTLLRGSILLFLGLVIAVALCLAPLLNLSVLATGILSTPSVIGAIVRALVLVLDVAGTLLAAIRLLGRALLTTPNWLILVGYLTLAGALVYGWTYILLRPYRVVLAKRDRRS